MPRKKSGLFDQEKYVKEYIRENVIRKMITFNKNNPDDMELLEHLKKQPEGMVAYVKRLIREDMRQPLPNHFNDPVCEFCRDTARADQLLNCSECPESKQ